MEPALCPQCGSQVIVQELGVLTLWDCSNCGWSGGEVGTPVFPEMPPSFPVEVVVRAFGPLPAEALRVLRARSNLASGIPITELNDALVKGVLLGMQPECMARELCAVLEPLGFEVICTRRKHET